MFNNIFGKDKKKATSNNSSQIKEALLRQIKEKSKDDPLIGAKIASKEILQRILEAMKSEKGVHTESLISAIGSLAGYSCQASIRGLMMLNKQDPNGAFIKAEGVDGKTYFFGDHLNKPLAENKISVWSLAAAGAQDAGNKELIDINEIFSHVTKTIGSEEFGVPRINDGHKPADPPIQYLKALWNPLLDIVNEFCPNPQLWPITFGLVLQQAIIMCKDTLNPHLALTIAMESAIPMSKVDINAY